MAFCSPAVLGKCQFLTRTPFTNSAKPAHINPTTAPTRHAQLVNFSMSASNTQNAPEPALRFGNGPHDLLVVGAGNLGVRTARQWREKYPDAMVMTATWSDARHDQLAGEGFIPVLSSKLQHRAPYVLFCAPPSRRQDLAAYVADIRRAGALATRRFVFTSATSVYVDDGRSVVTEKSPLANSQRARRMLLAESMAFAANRTTSVLRLGLLYDLTNGCHPWWLGTGNQYPAGSPYSVYNVVHYDDAAAAAVATLNAPRESGEVFIAVDNAPVTSAQMVRAAQMHPMYADSPTPVWSEGAYRKVVDGSWSQRVLGWTPKWKSFTAFFDAETKKIRGEGVVATE